MRYRYESFGGIIASYEPPFLAFVDRQYMREQGLTDESRWKDGDATISVLSAPVEVHFACTNRCSLGCSHCYMDSGSEDSETLDTEAFKRTLSTLADMGVFHVAMGGGEALERDDLFELAAHARSCGLVPNLTTNGKYVDRKTAEKLRVFGRINLSLDGVDEYARTYRDGIDFSEIDRAFTTLLDAGIPAGINCVVGRDNIDGLDDLFSYAARKGVSEIELLRFKPSGRGLSLYQQHRPTYEQNRTIYPLFQRCADRTKVKTKIDCSFVPMFCYHCPPIEEMEANYVCGCEAGNFLLGAKSDGRIAGCSFLPVLDVTLGELPGTWRDNPHLQQYRGWDSMKAEPCASCDYLRICKGGCHAVPWYLEGDIDAPDPDCPRVVEYHRRDGAVVQGHM